MAAHADGPNDLFDRRSARITGAPPFQVGDPPGQVQVRLRDLALRVTRGTETDTTDADLRNGVVHLSISRTSPHLMLRGSDGRTYRASVVTATWFVLRAPDFDKPVHGLEVIQVMFRGGPDKSPGWLREQIRWVRNKDSDVVTGPCDFATR